ncbi:hypothetical protein CCACVL1_25456 [Corchorus capsularis]|uniref:Uncharacterized protein n=1 Tax=Corchorus capsularis TaxID=210143 RepID=A0A1R3GK01_COCAP|nr:hypothetical protein CCACVL1_25456 [Corchorus capsularis]
MTIRVLARRSTPATPNVLLHLANLSPEDPKG